MTRKMILLVPCGMKPLKTEASSWEERIIAVTVSSS